MDWIQRYNDLLFQFYGLSFFVLGISIFVIQKRNTHFSFSQHLNWLALFGILHGFVGFLAGETLRQDASWIPWLIQLVLGCSFVALLEFGRRSWNSNHVVKRQGLTALGIYLVLSLSVIAITFWIENKQAGLGLGLRYLIGAPAAILCGIVILQRNSDLESNTPNEIFSPYMRLVSFSFLVFAFLILFVVIEIPQLDWVPTVDDFLVATGIPIRLPRTLFAILTTASFVMLLRKSGALIIDEEIYKKEEMYRALAENNQDIIVRYNKEHRHTYVNSAIMHATGRSAESYIGKTAREAGFPDHLCKLWNKGVDHVFTTGEPYFDTFEIVSMDGNIRTIDWRVFPERSNSGSVESVISVSRDITERRQAEVELQKLGKLTSLGVLAGGIAHDFNNILTMLFGNISMARSEYTKGRSGLKYLDKAEEAFQRAARLTNQLLTFAKGGNPIKKHIYLDKLIGDVASFDLAGSNVKLDFETDEDPWIVEADEGQLEQVFTNLVINAKQAMTSGGQLHIKVENKCLKGEVSGLSPGKYVKVTVSDEGIGITPEQLDKIFDPYFTTKQEGSGLGLATVYSIISKHNGHIEATSAPGKGATFSLYLPASESQHVSVEDKTLAQPKGKNHSGRILVMDDEEMICDLAAKILESSGYSVDVAKGGEQAIGMYRMSMDVARPYDCIIMDLTIPDGVGGKEAIGEMLKINPESKVIVSSGYAVDPVMANYAEYGFVGVLPKPFTPNSLYEEVHRVLNE